jgi:hypothetical protein
LIREHTSEPQTCDRCVDRGFGGVDDESRVDLNRRVCFAYLERPSFG